MPLTNNTRTIGFSYKYHHILNTLNWEEVEILIYRFDKNLNTLKTLREIGEIFDLSHERIRQKLAKTFRKLRRNKHLDIHTSNTYLTLDLKNFIRTIKKIKENKDAN